MAGNPWHDEKGRFTSQNAATDSYDNAVQAAEDNGDTAEAERLASERDEMIMKNDPESERGQRLLVQKYGATGGMKKSASPLGSASVSGKTRNKLRALFMSATDLDDTGFDVRERHGANILRGLVDNDDRHLQRAAKELSDDYNQEARERFGDSDADIKSFNSRVENRQKAMKDEPLSVPKDIKKRTHALLEAADYLGGHGKDVVNDDSNYIADSLLSGDEDGARTDLDNMEERLREESKRYKFFKGSDKAEFDSLLDNSK